MLCEDIFEEFRKHIDASGYSDAIEEKMIVIFTKEVLANKKKNEFKVWLQN